MPPSPRRRAIARFVARWRTEYAVGGVLLYLLVIGPLTVWKFPDSSLWLAVLILISGFLDQVKDLADQLADEGDET